MASVRRRRPLASIAVGCCLLAICSCTGRAGVGGAAGTGTAQRSHNAQPFRFRAGTRVCGQSVLNSPYYYNGPAGRYASGEPGLPTFGYPDSDFPHATAGVVLPAGTRSYASYQLRPDTVYYFLPGVYSGTFTARTNDAFVGGRAAGRGAVLDGKYTRSWNWAIDSNSTLGNQPGVTIEYLTIKRYRPEANAAAVNQDANSNWTIKYSTITQNVPGAGVMTGSNSILADNCMTLNGQYGFQTYDTNGFARDPVTGGVYNVTVENNEISYNDTCDFEGLLTNAAIGWNNHNPVPARYRNSHCGTVKPDGDQGGFKLWQTDGVTIRDNYIHHNWGVGGWADTDNANTTYTGNFIVSNDQEGLFEEISYNFAINGNYLAGNDWAGGLGNAGFPGPAIYISESGSDSTFGGVPACPQPSCVNQPAYPRRSVIRGNTLVNNGGNIFLWQNANRYCSDGSEGVCTLTGGAASGPFTIASCKAHWPGAAIDVASFAGKRTGTPVRNWWNGCLWQTANVSVIRNVIDFNPAQVPDCNQTAWPACGAGGIFSNYGSPPDNVGPWVIATELTFFQHNSWSGNVYNGPSTFYAWNQGNNDNPVSWSDWTGRLADGDKCSAASNRQGGHCRGPFGQDRGSSYSQVPTFSQ